MRNKIAAVGMLGPAVALSLTHAKSPADYVNDGWKTMELEPSPSQNCPGCVLIKFEKNGQTIMCEVPLYHWDVQPCHLPLP